MMRRLDGMRETIKRRSSLDAMKLYRLLLAFRDTKGLHAHSHHTRSAISAIACPTPIHIGAQHVAAFDPMPWSSARMLAGEPA